MAFWRLQRMFVKQINWLTPHLVLNVNAFGVLGERNQEKFHEVSHFLPRAGRYKGYEGTGTNPHRNPVLGLLNLLFRDAALKEKDPSRLYH